MLQIQGYKVIREIGEGGMARVYLGIQESLEREVALKVLSPSLVADREFCTRFLREGKALAKLNHRHVVAIYDSGVQQEHFYLAMELISGGTLEDQLAKERLDPDRAIAILKQIAAALECAHRAGLIHRDIKPANVLFRDESTAVLSDFGIAKPTNAQTKMTAVGQAVGTPTYMSPEQASGKRVTPASDIYSLGVMFYEMLTGQVPYSGEDPLAIAVGHVHGPIPTLPPELRRYQAIVSRLMAKKPEDRFADARSLIDTLDRQTAETRVLSISGITSKHERFLYVGAALVAAVAVALVAYLWLPREAVQPPSPVVEPLPTAEQAPATQTPTGPSTAMTAPPDPGPTVELDAETRAKVAQLLDIAQSHYDIGRLTQPPGGNAFEVSQQVLELDPDNAAVPKMLADIARTYEQLAEESIDNGDVEEGKLYLQQGLRVAPDHPGLKQLAQRANGVAPAPSQ